MSTIDERIMAHKSTSSAGLATLEACWNNNPSGWATAAPGLLWRCYRAPCMPNQSPVA